MNETVDAMMRGRFAILQSRTGHRAGLDAMLLAATVPNGSTGHLLDLGAGVGTVAFAAITRSPALSATLIERDEATADRARRAVQLGANAHLDGRISVHTATVETVRTDGADFVLANPPYNDTSHQPSPDRTRRAAHEAPIGLLKDWIATANRHAKPGAAIAFILRPSWWPALTAAISDRDWGDVRLLPIHSRRDEPATRIIVRARKGRRTAASVQAPLVVHDANGAFTPEVAVLLDGVAGLPERLA